MSQQYTEHLKVLLSLYFVVRCKLLTFQLNSLRVLEGLCCFFFFFAISIPSLSGSLLRYEVWLPAHIQVSVFTHLHTNALGSPLRMQTPLASLGGHWVLPGGGGGEVFVWNHPYSALLPLQLWKWMKTNQMRKAKAILNLLQQGYQPSSLGRHSKAGTGVGKLQSEKRGRLQVYPDWRMLAQRSRGWDKQKCSLIG